MASSRRNVIQRGLDMIRNLPRVEKTNIRDNPGARKQPMHGRGRYRGKTQGCGSKGALARQRYSPPGFEPGRIPLHRRVPSEPYNEGHHLRREYFPLSLLKLQEFIDMGFLNPEEPIDLTSICNTKQYFIDHVRREFGIQLVDKGLDLFKARVCIEVQFASEQVIAAVEKNGGIIRTAYYDIWSLECASNPEKFFWEGKPIPRRALPPQDLVDYYTNEKNRGYLADPEKIAEDRYVLGQKYGYAVPDLTKDPWVKYVIEMSRKDPRQIFVGLQPGWVINMKDRKILKPTDEMLLKYYTS